MTGPWKFQRQVDHQSICNLYVHLITIRVLSVCSVLLGRGECQAIRPKNPENETVGELLFQFWLGFTGVLFWFVPLRRAKN